jgi:hypothetical protein
MKALGMRPWLFDVTCVIVFLGYVLVEMLFC